MPLRTLHRWLEPAAWPGRQGWTSRLGSWLGSNLRHPYRETPARGSRTGRRAQALATARLEFAEALFDIHSLAAADVLDRVAVCRSLPELWHLREAVFSLIARRHDQAEAGRRVGELDVHFRRRGAAATQPPPHLLDEPC